MNKRITVIGGGIAGLACAIKLKMRGLDVSVFESGGYSSLVAGEHLGADGKMVFQQLGIPEEVWMPYSTPCREVQSAWAQSTLHYNESIFNPYGDGILLLRPAFDAALSRYAESVGVLLAKDSRVMKIEKMEAGWQLQLKGQADVVKSDFVIDASGRNSKFYHDFGTEKTDYDELIGLTKRSIKLQEKNITNSFLLIESTPDGWWYSVQLKNGTFIATFMTDASILQLAKQKQDEFWHDQLQKTNFIKERLRDAKFSKDCFTQSARTHRLSKMAGENWLCIGDAAMAYDPLSSTGIIKGLRMGEQAANALAAYWSSDKTALEHYEKKHQKQFEEYLEQKRHFYQKEYRWNESPFWYKRNIIPSAIEDFSILPDAKLSLKKNFATENAKLEYLREQLPSVNILHLLNCIKQQPIAHSAMKAYLEAEGESTISRPLLQALESMRLIGLIFIESTS